MIKRGNTREIGSISDVLRLMDNNFEAFADVVNHNEKKLRQHINAGRTVEFFKFGAAIAILYALANYIRQNENEKKDLEARIVKVEARCTPIEEEGEPLDPAG